MTAEPQEYYDHLRHQRAQKQINEIGPDACALIARAMGWMLLRGQDVTKTTRQYLQQQNDEVLEADTNK